MADVPLHRAMAATSHAPAGLDARLERVERAVVGLYDAVTAWRFDPAAGPKAFTVALDELVSEIRDVQRDRAAVWAAIANQAGGGGVSGGG